MGFLKSLSKELYNIINCYKIQIEEVDIEIENKNIYNSHFFSCYKIEEDKEEDKEEEYIYDRKIFNNYRTYIESHV